MVIMKRIAYTFGMFDLIHYGHIKLLDKMLENSDLVLIGVLTDEISERLFGKLLSPLKERTKVLEGLSYVDEVFIQNKINPLDNLIKIKEKYPLDEITIYHSNNWIFLIYGETLRQNGFKIYLTEYSHEFSNEKIKEIFNSSHIKQSSTFIGSKGETLYKLNQIVRKSKIEPLYLFYRSELINLKSNNLEQILRNLSAEKFVVRSSSSSEDGISESNAGKYLSVVDLPFNTNIILQAINDVFKSYETSNIDDHVIIQRMTVNSKFSGVIFTRELRENAPYYLINYTGENDTTIVTSGKDSSRKTLFKTYSVTAEPWKNLIHAVKEIEDLFENLPLDIEFSITGNNEPIIHQVRPLITGSRVSLNYDKIIDSKLLEIRKFLHNKDNEFYLSDMAFWNPSEIIGSNPVPLAYSLYHELITSLSWNTGISEIGYTSIKEQLMYKLGNKPYIDLSKTFISLTPESLPWDLKNKLSNYYLSLLRDKPFLHDKIEFEVVINCFNFNIEKKIGKLPRSVFDNEEKIIFFDRIKGLTRTIIKGFQTQSRLDRLAADDFLKELSILEKSTNLLDKIEKMTLLTSQTIAPVFSRQARYAFVSKNIIDSALDIKLINEETYDNFFSSINTIASDYIRESKLLKLGQISTKDFNSKYGHLRSGTYDITEMPYSSLPENHFGSESYKTEKKNTQQAQSKLAFVQLLSTLSSELEIEDRTSIFEFLFRSISAREEFKFIYSKGVSRIIESIAEFGESKGYSRNEMQFITIKDLIHIARLDSEQDLEETLSLLIKGRKRDFELNAKMLLPEIIFNSDDVMFFESHIARANFVTRKKIDAEIVILDGTFVDNIDGKIIVIENADPGYDWVFNHQIAGLVTKYGGAASHMTIRCSEMGIPAAIGVGDIMFERVLASKYVMLDAKKQKLEIVR